MPRERVLAFHRVDSRDRSGKLAANGGRERTTAFNSGSLAKSSAHPCRADAPGVEFAHTKKAGCPA